MEKKLIFNIIPKTKVQPKNIIIINLTYHLPMYNMFTTFGTGRYYVLYIYIYKYIFNGYYISINYL